MLANKIELFDSVINYNSKSYIVKKQLLWGFLIFIILVFLLAIVLRNIIVNFGG